MSDPARTPERRRAHQGSPTGTERRVRVDDRRAENNQLHVSFRLGEVTFVLDIAQVREVVQVQEVTRVPLGASLIAGLINLRGEIVPAIDLRPLLGGPLPAHEGASAMLVLVRSEAHAFGLVVDEVHDILAVSPSMLLAPPANLPATLKPLTEAICKLPDRLVFALSLPGVAQLVAAAPPCGAPPSAA